MGPFLAAGSGETTEWCDSGVEGWKKQEGGRQRTRKQRRAAKEGERRKERDKEGKGRGGCRRQVLISNRLLVMRSLSHCAQIDVM